MIDQEFFGNSVQLWLVALAIAAACFVFLKALQWVVVHRLAKVAARTETKFDDLLVEVLRKTRFFFVFLVSVFAGSYVVTLPPSTELLLQRLVVLALLLQGALWASAAVTFLLTREMKRRMEEDAASATTLSGVGFVLKFALWVIVLLLALDNLGVNVTGLVAGLGIGGIAVALALQSVLGDLFASLSIVLDKPFVIGDFIIVDDLLGTVEYVGLKTTRLRSLSGEQIIFSNADLLKSRIRNYKRMYERRIVFTVGVTYQTTRKQLEAISTILREVVESQENTRFDRAHFKEYGDSALVYEVVYFVKSPDYNTYMDVQQAINLEVFRRFEDLGVSFAYPTRTLFIEQESAGDEANTAAPAKSDGKAKNG